MWAKVEDMLSLTVLAPSVLYSFFIPTGVFSEQF